MRLSRILSIAAQGLISSVATAADINGYAVGNHRACGAANLPGTIAELAKFFASEHFPEDARKNFQWNDARVVAGDWATAHDAFASTETVNGFDGVDSSLIAYIASHGVTSSGKYTILAGGANNACYISTPDINVGDQRARYLVLSTCQGLKIGTGDDPTRAGENPEVTWANANQGLNCVFGYSNNMVDGDLYGDYLLENLATSDDTLAEAFFRASRRISPSNIPAALCFGPDAAAARRNLETARRFTDDRYGRGGSAWSYERARRVEQTFELPQGSIVIPRVIKTATRRIAPSKLARYLVGDKATEMDVTGGLKAYRAGTSTMTFNPRTSVVTWRSGDLSLAHGSALRDSTAIKVAKDFLMSHGMIANPGELKTSYIVDRGASVGGHTVVVAKTVVFHQEIRGLTPLGSAGSVEVLVDADGRVVSLTSALIDTAQLRVSEWLDVSTMNLSSHRDIAKQRLAYRLPDANVAVLETRVGYDVGDYRKINDRSRVMVEVLLEAEQGGFTRRYVEKVPL